MRLSVALAVSAVLPFAVGCSSYADTSAKQVEKDVKAAMAGVESVHIAGGITTEGTRLDIDVALDSKGDCEGSVALGALGKFQLLGVQGQTYVKPADSFWKASGAGALSKQAKGKWLTGATAFKDLTDFCDLDGLMKSISSDNDNFSKVRSTDTKIDGQDVVKVASKTTDGTEATLYVLSDDPHYVVKAEVADEGSITFSDFDEAVEPKAPAKNQIVDASKLR